MRYVHFLRLFLFVISAAALAQSNPPLFAPPVTYGSSGQDGASVAVADLNGDGNPDLIITNSNGAGLGTVGVLLSNGDGTFQPAVTYVAGYGALGITVADVNGDSKPDLLVATGVHWLCVLLGNGNGTFQQATYNWSGGDTPSSVAVADVNGDGMPDVQMANLCPSFYGCSTANGTVGVLLGNGDGTFHSVAIYDSKAYESSSVAVGDVNADGMPDLIVASACATPFPDCVSGGVVGVLLGNGDGTFQPPVNYGSAGQNSHSVAVTDVNGDGKPDVVVANYASNNVGVLLGNGDGTFQAALAYPSGGFLPLSVAVADVNRDGNPDLLVANHCVTGSYCINATGTVSVLLGNGDGTFQTALPYAAGGVPYSLAVADVNGDGMPDVLVANECARYGSNGLCVDDTGSVGVLINVLSPYKASVQQPINSDGSSTFKANRGVIPVKFTLTKDDMPTCELPEAKIALKNISGSTAAAVDESTYSMAADSGSTFRVSSCQYIYNLRISSAELGVGVYEVDISINGVSVGSGKFALK